MPIRFDIRWSIGDVCSGTLTILSDQDSILSKSQALYAHISRITKHTPISHTIEERTMRNEGSLIVVSVKMKVVSKHIMSCLEQTYPDMNNYQVGVICLPDHRPINIVTAEDLAKAQSGNVLTRSVAACVVKLIRVEPEYTIVKLMQPRTLVDEAVWYVCLWRAGTGYIAEPLKAPHPYMDCTYADSCYTPKRGSKCVDARTQVASTCLICMESAAECYMYCCESICVCTACVKEIMLRDGSCPTCRKAVAAYTTVLYIS